jgi:molybdopterin-guanine dinucleotide biosynthesis protein A
MDDISVAVLAGGASRRFGSNKALAEWEGATVIESVIRAAAAVSGHVFIVSGERAALEFTGLEIIPDIHPGQGPLAGLEAALEWTESSRVMLLACDMPLLPPSLLVYLAGISFEQDADITAPVVNNMFQPLCAVYKQEILGEVRAMLHRGELSIRGLLDAFGCYPVKEDDMEKVLECPPVLALASANTPDSLRTMRLFRKKIKKSGDS